MRDGVGGRVQVPPNRKQTPTEESSFLFLVGDLGNILDPARVNAFMPGIKMSKQIKFAPKSRFMLFIL